MGSRKTALSFIFLLLLAPTASETKTPIHKAASYHFREACGAQRLEHRARRQEYRSRGSAVEGGRLRNERFISLCWISSCWPRVTNIEPDALPSILRARCPRHVLHVSSLPRRRTHIMSMKAKARAGKRRIPASTSTATRQMHKAIYITIEDLGRDSWRLVEAAEILKRGGIGVIPTDTSYTFACDLMSRKGLERIMQIKSQQIRRKPLSLLCKDMSSISTYTNSISKTLFKTMKATLPGPFTFILPSNNEVPRMLMNHKQLKKTWKRREIGVRIPDSPILAELLAQLDGPVLCSSVPPIGRDSKDEAGRGQAGLGEGDGDRWRDDPDEEEAWDERERGEHWGDDAFVSGDPAAIDRTWGHAVDFVVDAGFLEVKGFSTVVDALGPEPIVIREGLGDPSLISD